jgi:TetR/AcrR family transcriptional repressor of nem operon
MSRLHATASPGRAITGFFEETIEGSLCDALQRGCMLVNSALEASPENAELRDGIANELGLIEGFFHDCLIAGQACGEISSAHSADDAARQLLAVLLGIRVLARVRPERALLTGAVRPTLEVLGLPPLKTAVGAAKSPRRRS